MQQLLRLGNALRDLALVVQPSPEEVWRFTQPVVAGVDNGRELMLVLQRAKAELMMFRPAIEGGGQRRIGGLIGGGETEQVDGVGGVHYPAVGQPLPAHAGGNGFDFVFGGAECPA